MKFIQTTFIVPPAPSSRPYFDHTSNDQLVTVKEVLSRFIAREIRAGNDANVLCKGYRKKRWNAVNQGMRSNHDIDCYFVNTTHSFFQLPQWQAIVNTYDEQTLAHIMSCQCFVPAANNNYIQISGAPVIQYNQATSASTQPTNLLTILNNCVNPTTQAPINSAAHNKSTSIPRQAIMYHKTCRNRIGLPFYHIFNQSKLSTIQIYSHIFASQEFRLIENLMKWQSDAIPTGRMIHDSLPRHNSAFIPESLLTMIESIIKGYRQSNLLLRAFSYFAKKVDVTPVMPVPIMNDAPPAVLGTKKRKRGCRGGSRRKNYKRSCQLATGGSIESKQPPIRRIVPLATDTVTRVLSSAIVRMPEEYGTQDDGPVIREVLTSQQNVAFQPTPSASIYSYPSTQSAKVPSPAAVLFGNQQFLLSKDKMHLLPSYLPGASAPLNFFSLATPASQVSLFVKALCRRVFSKGTVWGSRHNLNVFMANIDTYIHLNKGETMTTDALLHRLRIKDIPWLTDVSWTWTHSDRSNSLRNFLYWIFADFINPLLANSFYITEVETKGSELFYYRKRDWDQIVARGRDQLHRQFQEVDSGRTIMRTRR